MESEKRTRYTVAFVFDEGLEHVLLVHKKKPDWQKGFLNGIGGKHEPGETSAECIHRETIEESRLDIPESAWIGVGTIRRGPAEVDVMTARHRGDRAEAVMADYEEVEWFPVSALPPNMIDNLAWLIPLCIERHRSGFTAFSIEY